MSQEKLMPACTRCGGSDCTKNGFMQGDQRYKCRACGYNFTDKPPRGHPPATKAMAVWLYMSGLSMNRIGKLVGVSTVSVMRWIRAHAEKHAPKPVPDPDGPGVVVVELDEMWHFLKKSPRRYGSGRLLILIEGGCSTGSAGVVIGRPSTGCLAA